MYDVVFIGNCTKDTIVTPGSVKVMSGGAVSYAAHAAVRLGLKVGVVTRLAREDQEVVRQMKTAGVDCLVEYTPQSTCVTLEYPDANPDIRKLSISSSAGAFTPQQVQPVEAHAFAVGPIFRGEVGLDVLRALRAKPGVLLAGDMQGYVRVLRGGSVLYEAWDEFHAVLSCLDVVKVDIVEAKYLTGDPDALGAAKKLSALGPREVVLTHQDGLLVYAGGAAYRAPWRPEKIVGRTGRGDTCLGSYLARRLSAPPAEATLFAAALTSLKMETPGPFNRSLAEVEDFMRKYYLPL